MPEGRLFIKFISKMLCPQDTSNVCSISLSQYILSSMYYLLSRQHQYLKG